MEKIYINGCGSVTAQVVDWTENWNWGQLLTQEVNYAQQPVYKDLIPAAVIRRMAKGVKMGIYAAQQALDQAGLPLPDAIITGTGMGCLQDSEKFLRAIIDNKEAYLTPTSFIQSTHNTVGGQIALRLECKGYNFTYVNGAVSFESALIDAFLQIRSGELQNALVGGVDEISDHTLSLLQLIGYVNTPDVIHGPNGINLGEGATFFSLENRKTPSSFAEVLDVSIHNRLDVEELPEYAGRFLSENQVEWPDIDAVVFGANGNENNDAYYRELSRLLPDAAQFQYKDYTGEYDTASAFGLLMGAHLLRDQKISELFLKKSSQKKVFKKVLIYNQLRGKDHSLTLLGIC